MSSLSKRLFRHLPVARSTRAYAFTRELLHLPSAARLLDIGSGGGYGSAYLSRVYPEAHVFGTDINFECRQGSHPEYGPRRPIYVQANAPFLPFAEKSLDAVFLVMTFHCLPQPQRVIEEAARTLKENGVLVIADVNGAHWMARPFEWFEHLFISPLTHAWRADELHALCKNAGLKDVTVHHRPGKENGFMQWLIVHK